MRKLKEMFVNYVNFKMKLSISRETSLCDLVLAILLLLPPSASAFATPKVY